MSSQRIGKLFGHLEAQPTSATATTAAAPVEVFPNVVLDPENRMSVDPVHFLIDSGRKNPGCFMLKRSEHNKFVVITDVEMFEDVLTFDDCFGNPVTPNMSVNKNVFGIPVEQLEKYEQKAIGALRPFILTNNDKLSDQIAALLLQRMDSSLGESGEMDLRDFGTNIFWPMTQALFGDGASQANAPYLKDMFEDIDGNFSLALKGKKVPAVTAAVDRAYNNFSAMVEESKRPGGCPLGPVAQMYDRVTEYSDPKLTAKLCTAAWWGGQGNTLPSTVWTFGMILANPEIKQKVIQEVFEGPFRSQPNQAGEYDYATLPYLTAALKETLRMKTYSIAWRLVQKDCTLFSPQANKTFKFNKGDLIGLHFAMRHLDDRIHPQPEVFRPERFLGTGAGLSPTINGHRYAFAPFSAGMHKCAGYGLAMLEIPVVAALILRHYDMELIDPLPGMNYKEAFGVVGPDDKPARIQYKKRA